MEYIINDDWKSLFYSDAFSKANLDEILENVEERIDAGDTVYPPRESVFAAFNKTPLDMVRVVILGQDPYHGPGQANGLAFSVNEGIPLPRSLSNIFKELKDDIGGELRNDGDLSDWAEQGVLLMNTALTVTEHDPDGMTKLWTPFTDEVIKALNENESPIVFVLWGNNARKKKKFITNSVHHIIESAHPSPLSASRGFFKTAPFGKVNDFLIADGFDAIKWN